jgi:hypothetical protein
VICTEKPQFIRPTTIPLSPSHTRNVERDTEREMSGPRERLFGCFYAVAGCTATEVNTARCHPLAKLAKPLVYTQSSGARRRGHPAAPPASSTTVTTGLPLSRPEMVASPTTLISMSSLTPTSELGDAPSSPCRSSGSGPWASTCWSPLVTL